MKINIAILITWIFIALSCNQNSKIDDGHGAHAEDQPDGVVMLNKKQIEALNLKLGSFHWRNLTTVVKVNGQLEVAPSSSADITAIIGGNVKEIKVFHGDKVKQGQVLAVLEHPDYIVLQEDFAAVASRLEYLENDYERQKELFENNIGAGKDYQRVKSDFNIEKARFAGLKSRLELLKISPDKVLGGDITKSIRIVSPIKGYVNEVNIKLGTYLDANNKLFSITDNSALHADFMVYEKDVHLIKEGQLVHFTVSNRSGDELTAKVFAVGKEFEPNTRAVHIHADLSENPGNLIPGMYISGHFHADENYSRTLPEDAVVGDGTKSYIFIQDEESADHDDHAEAEDQHDEVESHVGHDHEAESLAEQSIDAESHEGHDHENEEPEHDEMAFRMVEVITGSSDEGYVEVKLLDSLDEHSKIVQNAAYYLLADMKKGETEHKH